MNYNRTIPSLKRVGQIEKITNADVYDHLRRDEQGLKPSINDYYESHATNMGPADPVNPEMAANPAAGKKTGGVNTLVTAAAVGGGRRHPQAPSTVMSLTGGTTNCASPEMRPTTGSRGLSNYSSIKMGDHRLAYHTTFAKEAFRMPEDRVGEVKFDLKQQKLPKQQYLDYREALEVVSPERLLELQTQIRDKVQQRASAGGNELRKAFKQFDRDGRGSINMSEFKRALNQMHINISDIELVALFGSINHSCSGQINYYEFVDNFMEISEGAKQRLDKLLDFLIDPSGAMLDSERSGMSGEEMTDDMIRRLFHEMDHNKDNQITTSEFSQLLRRLGKNLTAEEEAIAFRRLDTDSSDFIEFDEFLNWFRNTYDAEKHRRSVHRATLEERRSKSREAKRLSEECK